MVMKKILPGDFKIILASTRRLLFLISLLVVSCTTTIYYRTELNYGEELERLATEFELPAEYLKALVILESSGRKKVPSRYEKHVYNRLLNLKNGKRKRYENLRPHHLKDASNAALKNLASSWGPFQLMGYKCLALGVNISDIRGDDALYWGVFWINKEYGDYLRQNKFEEAFRIHNTGSPSGKTYNSNYVSEGLTHIAYFKKD